MDSRIHFLTGLPRSGNTVLASLLSQSPDIYAGPASPLVHSIYALDQVRHSEAYRAFDMRGPFDDMVKSAVAAYYKWCSATIILDRGAWGTRENSRIAKQYVNANAKYVIPIRPVQEIVASMLRWAELNPESFLAKIPSKEERISAILADDGHLMKGLSSIKNLFELESPENVLFVEYGEFLRMPVACLNGIRAFLGLPQHDYQLNSIQQLTVLGNTYRDADVNEHNLHRIRENGVSAPCYSMHDYLSDGDIARLEQLNIWSLPAPESAGAANATK